MSINVLDVTFAMGVLIRKEAHEFDNMETENIIISELGLCCFVRHKNVASIHTGESLYPCAKALLDVPRTARLRRAVDVPNITFHSSFYRETLWNSCFV